MAEVLGFLHPCGKTWNLEENSAFWQLPASDPGVVAIWEVIQQMKDLSLSLHSPHSNLVSSQDNYIFQIKKKKKTKSLKEK